MVAAKHQNSMAAAESAYNQMAKMAQRRGKMKSINQLAAAGGVAAAVSA